MGRDRSYDRGRAWRGGNEEEGGYGGSGLQGSDAILQRPRYGRYPGGTSNGGVEYREVEGRDRARGERSFAGVGPRGYRRSDERIAEDVCERFTRHAYLDASEIEVEVKDGEVTLEGEVESRTAKRLAEDIAEAASGVLDVHNRLRIRATGPDPEPLDPPTL